MLREPLLQADAENRPVYLESSSLANNAYYAKQYGFVVVKEIFLERGPAPVQLSIMVREPQPIAKFANITTTAGALKAKTATTAVRTV